MSGHCVVANARERNVWAFYCIANTQTLLALGLEAISYKASVSILDSAKCVTACLLMIQGPAASALTLIMKYLKAKEELWNLKYFTIAKIY
jgi:hypothetical protein